MRILLALFLFASIATSQTRHDFWIPVGPVDSLDATIFTPTTPPPNARGYPTILFIHGFGLNKDWDTSNCIVYARRGFVTMCYSVRGHGQSTGLSTIMCDRERQDMGVVINVLKGLPLVDSTAVGVAGGSQGGLHALWAAIDHPELGAVSADVIVPNWVCDMLANGAQRRTLMTLLSTASVRYAGIRDTLWAFLRADQQDSLLKHIPECREVDTISLSKATVPIALFLKWQDHYFSASNGIRSFGALTNQRKLYIGTVGHYSDASVGESTFQNDQFTRWFTYFLGHVPTGILDDPQITIGYSSLPMDSSGDFTWSHQALSDWPPVGAQLFKFYLSRDSVLSYTSPVGARDSFVVQNNYRDSNYTFDSGFLENFHGSHFRNALPRSAAVFISDPLPRPVTWVGAPRMHLYASATGEKFPLNAQIYEQDSTGRKYFINRIDFTGRHWQPGVAGVIDARGIPHAHRFTAGNRIRIELTNLDVSNRQLMGDYPFVIPVLANVSATVYSSPAEQSYIELPLNDVPTGAPLFAETLPESPVLYQNYPNPFNPTTAISFQLSAASKAQIAVYDLLGREVATLVDEWKQAGFHSVQWDASGFSSGVYLYKLKAGAFSTAKKMLLVR